jgi:hypothetical protein
MDGVAGLEGDMRRRDFPATATVYLFAYNKSVPLDLGVRVLAARDAADLPSDLVTINDITLYLSREQTKAVAAKLAELIAMPEDGVSLPPSAGE